MPKRKDENPLETIRDAGQVGKQVTIAYIKKNGDLVERTIRPYEIKNGKVWATDDIHGAQRIHSFKQERILLADETDKKFRPVWPVML